MVDYSQQSNQDAWEQLKREIIDRIKAIDESTPWSNTEPQWWLEMMSIQKQLIEK